MTKSELMKTVDEVLTEHTELSEKEREELTETLVDRLQLELEIVDDDEDEEEEESEADLEEAVFED